MSLLNLCAVKLRLYRDTDQKFTAGNNLRGVALEQTTRENHQEGGFLTLLKHSHCSKIRFGCASTRDRLRAELLVIYSNFRNSLQYTNLAHKNNSGYYCILTGYQAFSHAICVY